jgi:hypothetical protein
MPSCPPAVPAGDRIFAAYSINIADVLTSQLQRLAALHPHQLAGHVANLDFWAGEVAHCLEVIDRYGVRFERLSSAQKEYEVAQRSMAHLPGDDMRRPDERPKRIPDNERLRARRVLCDAFYRFLVRCHNVGLIDESEVRSRCQRLNISVDSNDLKRAQS